MIKSLHGRENVFYLIQFCYRLIQLMHKWVDFNDSVYFEQKSFQIGRKADPLSFQIEI